MDSQRPFLYLTLVFVLFLIWTSWQQDQMDQAAKLAAANQPQVQQQAAAPVPVSATGDDVPVLQAGSTPAVPGQAGATVGTEGEQFISVRTDTLNLRISTRGGTVQEADLPTYPVSLEEPDNPVRILDLHGRNYIAQSGLLHQAITGQDTQALAPDHTALYTAPQSAFTLAEGEDTLVVPLTWQNSNGITVTKRFTFKRGSFQIAVEHEVQNNSNQVWSGSAYRQLKHGKEEGSSGIFSLYTYVGGAYFDEHFTKYSFGDMEEKNLESTVKGGWVSMMEHYFLSAWVPSQTEDSAYYSMTAHNQGNKAYVLGLRGPVLQIASGAQDSFQSTLYIGPKDQDTLAAMAEGLDLTVDYGMFAFISKPIFWVMQFIHNFVGNWGWTIIFLTILIKALFFWPSAVSYKSMAKMKAMAPKMKEINERYADDPQGKQKAMMEIYRKEKINPLGGCLPILIQIPVFMGLYWVLLESVELRQAPWILWYEDLSLMDPFFILPIIMGASMYLQQKLNPPQVDPMQQKIFQFLPVIFTVMFLFFPAGLVLYWVVNNILSMAQQWYINKKIIGHA